MDPGGFRTETVTRYRRRRRDMGSFPLPRPDPRSPGFPDYTDRDFHLVVRRGTRVLRVPRVESRFPLVLGAGVICGGGLPDPERLPRRLPESDPPG